jgi:hypothetical protein
LKKLAEKKQNENNWAIYYDLCGASVSCAVARMENVYIEGNLIKKKIKNCYNCKYIDSINYDLDTKGNKLYPCSNPSVRATRIAEYEISDLDVKGCFKKDKL